MNQISIKIFPKDHPLQLKQYFISINCINKVAIDEHQLLSIHLHFQFTDERYSIKMNTIEMKFEKIVDLVLINNVACIPIYTLFFTNSPRAYRPHYQYQYHHNELSNTFSIITVIFWKWEMNKRYCDACNLWFM